MDSDHFNVEASERELLTGTQEISGAITESALLYTDKQEKQIQSQVSKDSIQQDQQQQPNQDASYSASCNKFEMDATQSLKASQQTDASTSLASNENLEETTISRQFAHSCAIDKAGLIDKEPDEDDLESTQIFTKNE